jgi:CheY-like chemotaxis protein
MMHFAQKNKEKNELFNGSWKVLIVDDEQEVHSITKSVLKKFEFHNKNLIFYSAYNSKDALEILEKHGDIALVFLDVVMETDDAGLIVAKAIREELKNNIVRIVLRTGQPGLAPEKEIIHDYDINDYREKTELTSSKLYTATITALRSYKDLLTIESTLAEIRKRAFLTASLKNKLNEEYIKTVKEKDNIIQSKNNKIDDLTNRLKIIKERLIDILQNHHEELNKETVERIRKVYPGFVALEDEILEHK